MPRHYKKKGWPNKNKTGNSPAFESMRHGRSARGLKSGRTQAKGHMKARQITRDVTQFDSKTLIQSSNFLNRNLHRGGMNKETTLKFINDLNDNLEELKRRGIEFEEQDDFTFEIQMKSNR